MTEQEAQAEAEARTRWPYETMESRRTRGVFLAGAAWERSRHSPRVVEAAPSDTRGEGPKEDNDEHGIPTLAGTVRHGADGPASNEAGLCGVGDGHLCRERRIRGDGRPGEALEGVQGEDSDDRLGAPASAPSDTDREAAIEAVAQVMFEPPSLGQVDDPEYTWAQMVVEDPTRADMYRQDAAAALEAAARASQPVQVEPWNTENLEIVNGWLVERGANPLDYPAGAEYGAMPYSDAEPLVHLSEIPGWPVQVEVTEVATREELDALPIGAVIHDARRWTVTKAQLGEEEVADDIDPDTGELRPAWWLMGHEGEWPVEAILLPATVLWVPADAAALGGGE